MDIRLAPMTREYMHELFQGFVYDPDTFLDMSLYEKVKSSAYDPRRVDAMYDKHSREEDRRSFAVLRGETVIGQVDLKHIDPREKTCELSINLQNDAVKNKGYGTRAERLAIAYAFDTLGMETVLADCVEKNHRSRHVLEKLGFTLVREENGFKYYRMNRTERGQ